MATREVIVDGKRAVEVDTEEEFARALDRGLPIAAPPEIAAAFGFPVDQEPHAFTEDRAAEADDSRPDPENPS